MEEGAETSPWKRGRPFGRPVFYSLPVDGNIQKPCEERSNTRCSSHVRGVISGVRDSGVLGYRGRSTNEHCGGRKGFQSGFRAEDAEDYRYGKLESLVPAMREQSARLREQHQRELKRHLRNEQELAKLRAQKQARKRQR
jgi:hypothetical protein